MNMTQFTKETKFGLTFGQLLSLIALIFGMIAAWVTINVRIATAETRIEQLEMGRQENARNIQQLYQDNREDHKEMIEKLDKVIIEIKTIK